MAYKSMYKNEIARAAVKALTAEQKTAFAEAFANQKKYSSLQGYMFAQEYAKLV